MKTVTIGNMQDLPYAMEEAVNRLRVNIGFLGENVRIIMITSTLPNEGKSLVSIELWRQMAQAGMPSILLDVDMRKSALSSVHPLEVMGETEPDTANRPDKADGAETRGPTKHARKVYGTSNYLSGETSLEDTLYHTQFEHGDIMINSDNVINPSIMLESKRFTDLLETLAQRYRYVFVDSPPLNLVSDGERIGSQCDGALLVVRSGYTPTSAVRTSMAQLERSGCPILGVVLNRVQGNRGEYYSKRYGKYSYYGNKKDGAYYYR